MAQDDELRRLVAAARDGQVAAHAQAPHRQSSSRTSTSQAGLAASSRAASATLVGVIRLAGSFARLRAQFTPSPTACPRVTADRRHPGASRQLASDDQHLLERRQLALVWPRAIRLRPPHRVDGPPRRRSGLRHRCPVGAFRARSPMRLAVDCHSARTPALTTCHARCTSYSSREPAATTTSRPPPVFAARRRCVDRGEDLGAPPSRATHSASSLEISRRRRGGIALLEHGHDHGIELLAIERRRRCGTASRSSFWWVGGRKKY